MSRGQQRHERAPDAARARLAPPSRLLHAVLTLFGASNQMLAGIVLHNASLAAESSAALANALAGTLLLCLAAFLVLTGWRRLRAV